MYYLHWHKPITSNTAQVRQDSLNLVSTKTFRKFSLNWWYSLYLFQNSHRNLSIRENGLNIHNGVWTTKHTLHQYYYHQTAMIGMKILDRRSVEQRTNSRNHDYRLIGIVQGEEHAVKNEVNDEQVLWKNSNSNKVPTN